MARSFDIFTDSPATVEEVHAAFSREDYWLARFEAFDNSASTLDSLIVDADGTVTMIATQHLGRQLLPGVFAKFVPGELRIHHRETWRPIDDRRVRGQVDVSAGGTLISGRAEAWIAPAGTGSQLRFTATVEAKIPLLGGKVENSIEADLTESLPAIQRFTTAWISEHA